MKKLILSATFAAVAASGVVLPVAASAQSHHELRHDRERIREERRDVRDARREYREDVRDRDRHWGNDDWRHWRDRNRHLYARGTWRAPFRYRAFGPGVRIAPLYYGPRFIIADPWRYHLPPAGRYRHWVRHYNDVLLIDTRRGVVVRVIRNFYW